jgi:hypothetical protein
MNCSRNSNGNAALIMWGDLEDMHETSNKGRAFFLKNMLFSNKMEKFDSFQDHLLKTKDIRDQLKIEINSKENGRRYDGYHFKKFASFISKFIETPDITSTDKDLTFKQFSTKLLQQDRWKKQLRNSSGNESSEVALATMFKSKGSKHGEENDGNKFFESSKNRKSIKCLYCCKLGHISKVCMRQLWHENQNHGYSSDDQSKKKHANVAEHC